MYYSSHLVLKTNNTLALPPCLPPHSAAVRYTHFKANEDPARVSFITIHSKVPPSKANAISITYTQCSDFYVMLYWLPCQAHNIARKAV